MATDNTAPGRDVAPGAVPAVHVSQLVKRYGDMVALDYFDLDVTQGEIFGLLGPNGSGKTTAINCILALLTYDSGTIRVFGQPMTPTSYALKRRIGIVPQNVAVFNELTVTENIDYFCSLYVPKKTDRAPLVEESIEGWKEYEMEVMRDHAGNGIIVCSIENLDPMGVHTGDSITVAPAQTLSDLEYQRMRVASLAILEKIGVETGGSNVQFAVNPQTGRLIVIEMNPRVSRSSALASKATGFPIAKAAARLAVGYTLDEIVNDITKATPACFEPTIDYCVVKVPRFAFEKFKGTDPTLTTRMKAVGEIMAIGRTFEEAFGKAMRSLEDGHQGICAGGKEGADKLSDDELAQAVATPTEHRIFFVVEALRRGWDIAHIHAICGIDPWYLNRINDIVQVQESIRGLRVEDIDADAMRLLKQYGTSDAEIAALTGSDERFVRAYRKGLGVVPSMKTVDTCAAEFSSATEYHYKTYENIYRTSPDAKKCVAPDETTPADKPKALILGAGPNRIGQGIEFDYCCVHASYALAARGFETIMVNCNPETVS